MNRIMILDYPETMLFNVKKELPEFTDYCEVRQKILLYQLKKKKIHSPCHDYKDYVIEMVQEYPQEKIEIWTIGS